MLTMAHYSPGYRTRAVVTGRKNYYLSAVAEHGKTLGTWTGLRTQSWAACRLARSRTG